MSFQEIKRMSFGSQATVASSSMEIQPENMLVTYLRLYCSSVSNHGYIMVIDTDFLKLKSKNEKSRSEGVQKI